jgi:hypothetical protein
VSATAAAEVQVNNSSENLNANQQVHDLENSGNFQGALIVIESGGDAIGVMLQLERAKLLWRLGRKFDSDAQFESVVSSIELNDADANRRVHQLMELGLGAGDYEDKQRRSFGHLLAAARVSKFFGDAREVSLHFRDGLNGVAINRRAAVEWATYANALKTGNYLKSPPQDETEV